MTDSYYLYVKCHLCAFTVFQTVADLWKWRQTVDESKWSAVLISVVLRLSFILINYYHFPLSPFLLNISIMCSCNHYCQSALKRKPSTCPVGFDLLILPSKPYLLRNWPARGGGGDCSPELLYCYFWKTNCVNGPQGLSMLVYWKEGLLSIPVIFLLMCWSSEPLVLPFMSCLFGWFIMFLWDLVHVDWMRFLYVPCWVIRPFLRAAWGFWEGDE